MVIFDVAIQNVHSNLIFGQLYWVYAFCIFLYFFLAFWFLIKKFIKARKGIRLQYRYFLIGSLFAATTGFTTDVLLPGIMTFKFHGWGPVFTLVLLSFVAYAMVRHRLMDIRFAITRSLIFSILVLLASVIFGGIIYGMGRVLGGDKVVFDRRQIATILIASTIIVIALGPIKKYLAIITDKIFYKGQIDYDLLLNQISKIIAQELDIVHLEENTAKGLKNGLKLKKVDFLFYNKAEKIFSRASESKKKESVKAESSLIKYLEERNELIITEELIRLAQDVKDENERKKVERVVRQLEHHKASCAVPILLDGEISALLLLGEKNSGDVISTQEIKILEVLASQLGTAVEKARLYREASLFNVELQHKVKEATLDLKLTNKNLEEHNRYLTILQKISGSITRSLNFSEVSQLIADSISIDLGYIGGLLVFKDETGHNVRFEAMSKNEIADKIIKVMPVKPEKIQTSLGTDNKICYTVRNNKRVIGTKLSEFLHPPISSLVINSIQKIIKVKTIVCVPIESEAEPVGAILFFLRKLKSSITDTEFDMMDSLAAELGVVHRNLQMYQDLEEANTHLTELDQTKSEFLSIAAHQLRTPLSGIKGYISMMVEGDFGSLNAEQSKVMNELFANTNRLTRLVNIFLNVSRIEANRLKVEKEEFDLREIIDEIYLELKTSAEEKMIKLKYSQPENKIMVFADRDKMHDAIINLVDNSIKYTEKGSVDFGISENEKYVQVYIKDTGIGIKKSDLPKLFAKFVRGKKVSRINTAGAGLGLYIAKKIVEAHGGDITVSSKGLGGGTEFCIKLSKSAFKDKKAKVKLHENEA